MSLFRTTITASLRQTSRAVPATQPRFLSHTTCLRAEQPPPGNQPPSAKSANRSTHVADDPQSSASSKDPDEQKTGDDHPAKQPDTQISGDRTTGFHDFEGDVKGGKEGLGSRSDRK
ncbi:hypothetical protein LTR36_004780 [Oleoguttula mirabilis]|uniref:Uncharacterized protein n=1 Tax=Oleoguttula mirabilis TaxID=1507867 RepID=A0AAV9JFW2_9PEZI|nr:hypothetical protein LTR36_004780 [Oleoguttula mirabilis]